MNQTGTPAVSTRGHLMDHVAPSVTDLDAWIAKLRAERVTFLGPPYVPSAPSAPSVAGHRAILIEGPSREAIELLE